jgi:hypothetical protein
MKFQEPSARMAAAFRPNLPVAFFAAQGELAVFLRAIIGWRLRNCLKLAGIFHLQAALALSA